MTTATEKAVTVWHFAGAKLRDRRPRAPEERMTRERAEQFTGEMFAEWDADPDTARQKVRLTDLLLRVAAEEREACAKVVAERAHADMLAEALRECHHWFDPKSTFGNFTNSGYMRNRCAEALAAHERRIAQKEEDK